MDYKLGLIAKDIHNSVTPLIYKAFAKALGIKVSFEIFNIEHEQLYDTQLYFRHTMDGFNVTMPYKQKFFEFVDEKDKSAEECGSTNVILVKDKKFIAFNTDGWGLIKALSLNEFSVEDKKVVLVGAGGVALSIAYNLKLNHVKRVAVINKFPDETFRLCNRFGSVFKPHQLTDQNLFNCCKDSDLFINASVLGQVGYSDYDKFDFLEQLKDDAVVFDVNYSNTNAALLPAARSLGLKAYNGKRMTVCQGIRAMEIWTGLKPCDSTAASIIDSLDN